MDAEAKPSLFCSRCRIEYTTLDLEDKCPWCGDKLQDYEYSRPLNGFLKGDDKMTEDMSGKCSKCSGPMEKWREAKGYTCLECWKKDNPGKTASKGSFTPAKDVGPAKSLDELAGDMESCMTASKNLLNSVDKAIKWTSEDIRATGNTLFIQLNKER